MNRNETPSEVPAQAAETAAPVEVENKAVEKEEKEEAAPEENKIVLFVFPLFIF